MKKPRKLMTYEPAKIEKKWQKKWASSKIFKSKEDPNKPKYYVLDMFPYPSGEGLHAGHPKGYIATDVISRYRRMNGFSVLHPMGFDAFGLPAENYALKTKTHPAGATKKNVKRFKEQLELIGLDYDWSREINTTDPAYYIWTQWIFLQMFKRGLAYESNEPINWCPSCKTGLANEDIENGRCERCGTPVEKKPLRQWVLRITDYAERLLGDLEATDKSGRPLLDWPKSIVELQKNWIGKSEGASITFKLEVGDGAIEVFTTRPDTLFGVTYVVLAPEHKLVNGLLEMAGSPVKNADEVRDYAAKARLESEMERTDAKREKTGVEIKGVRAINPVNGESMPVWISDYVLADYGTGAVMAVPAHDQRDFEFATKYKLPVKQVIAPIFDDPTPVGHFRTDKPISNRASVYAIVKHWRDDKYLILDWKSTERHTFISGGIEKGEDGVLAATREIAEETGYTDIELVRDIGKAQGRFFADWKNENHDTAISGYFFRLKSDAQNPINPAELAKHTVRWVDRASIEETLNKTTFDPRFSFFFWSQTINRSAYTGNGLLVNSGKFDGMNSEDAKRAIVEAAGGSMKTTYKLRDWVFSRQRYWGEPIPLVHCATHGAVPVPEKELPVKLPTVKSYEPTGTGESPLAGIEKWVKTKCPICKGPARRETNTMPQWAGSSWYYLRYMDPSNKKAFVDPKNERYWSPVDLYVGGAEHATRHLIYARFWHKALYDLGLVSTVEPFTKLQHVGLIMGEDGRKMSKRFGNVVNPDDVVKVYGADSLRVYEMFMGPFDQQIAWSTASIVGTRRFIEKVWRTQEKVSDQPSPELDRIIHKTAKKVTDDIDALRFNTAVSSLMIAANEIDRAEEISCGTFEMFIKLFAPFAPHAAEEIWTALGNKTSVHVSEWPVYDPKLIVDDTANIIVQVNGKVRDSFSASQSASDEELTKLALNTAGAMKWIEGKQVKKTIVVKGRLVNIVVGDSLTL